MATRSMGKNGNGKMEQSKFHHLFMEEIKDIYWAEKALLKALPKMQKAATSQELMDAFEKHTEETQVHVERLEQIFEQMDKRAAGKKMRSYGWPY